VAIANRGYRRGGAPAGHATAATSGIEPLGKVRQSQMIATYGIGAIIDLEKGSFMPMGLEDWDNATRSPSLTIGEARLQAQLGVDHFRLPPIAEDIVELPGRVDSKHCVPAVRFPRWHECSQCHRIGTEGNPFQLSSDGSRLECTGHQSPGKTTPVRFVLACRKGHIDEFPWEWWAHRRRPDGKCDNPMLELKSRGKSAALSDLYIFCKGCKSSESLGDAFRPDAIKGFKCGGSRPWLHSREADCDVVPRVIQRGASNVHFPVIASALSIPPVSDGAFQIIESQWMALRALPAEAVIPVLTSIANEFGIDVDSLLPAYREKKNIEGVGGDYTDSGSRAEEYLALSRNRDDPNVGGVVPQFCNLVSDPPTAINKWFDLVGAVSRLREVRALAGFSRIEPYPVSGERIQRAIQDGFISPLSKARQNWLPAAEIRGEGLFLRFRTQSINEWIAANPEISARISILESRSASVAAARGYQRDYQITPRLLLVHSFSHALIRTISIDSGYSSSALRERLYVKEADANGPAMNGVLIYTGSPDSEGSLGGLVRLAEESQLLRIVQGAIRSAEWCGSDPVCRETDPRQSGDRISGAACHCCLLLPETACEKFNRELDRTMLVGSSPDEPSGTWKGFFDKAED